MKELRVILLNGPAAAGTYPAAQQLQDLLVDSCIMPVEDKHDVWLHDAAQKIDKCSYIIVPDAGWYTHKMLAERLVGDDRICVIEVHKRGAEWLPLEGSYSSVPERTHNVYRLHTDINDGSAGHALHRMVAMWEAGATYMDVNAPI